MTALLARALGRLPIGWLQLAHKPGRLAAAIAGVAFANVLVFAQLGFMGALSESAVMVYRGLAADVLISAPDFDTLFQSGTVPRSRAYQALAVPGVAQATPLYLGSADWDQPNGDTAGVQVIGVDPDAQVFRSAGLRDSVARLRRLDIALADRLTRGADTARLAAMPQGEPLETEIKGRRLTIEDTFAIGPGFEADGYLVVSDQTFLRLFPQRSAGAPDHVLVRVALGADPATVAADLRNVLPRSDSLVRTLGEAAEADRRYQTTERPVGIVFGFGVVMGVLVGVVIVYQVLSTDVAEHIAEYATLKAMGYGRRFFLGIVLEEAVILAVLGFLPGVVVSLGIYELIAAATGLPLVMPAWRPPMVLAGTIAMCALSGAVATRRLAAADPADLF